MAFSLPTLNLVCTLWHAAGPPYPPAGPHTNVPCQLRLIRTAFVVGAALSLGPFALLLVPAHTDIRGSAPGGAGDTIECPAGTGRFYAVLVVDDIAKGFANEYRLAVITQVQVPVPLP